MLTIETARIFEPLLNPSRYKGAWGGRGLGKFHYMAGAVVEYCLLNPGARIVFIREVQKTLAQSAKLLIENKIQEFGVGAEFRLYDRIETPGGGLIIFQGMQDQNAESINNVAWCEEALRPLGMFESLLFKYVYSRRAKARLLRSGF
jgi:phage terminase large subunit